MYHLTTFSVARVVPTIYVRRDYTQILLVITFLAPWCILSTNRPTLVTPPKRLQVDFNQTCAWPFCLLYFRFGLLSVWSWLRRCDWIYHRINHFQLRTNTIPNHNPNPNPGPNLKLSCELKSETSNIQWSPQQLSWTRMSDNLLQNIPFPFTLQLTDTAIALLARTICLLCIR